MANLAARLEKLPVLLAERAQRYRVPGASLAVALVDETFETATGVLSLDTGVEVTPDAVFQIGSITKLFTTTLVMQLVDEGRVELDAPVRTCLPELQLGDAEAARSVTVRQLLSHTSGIDGDFFQEAGRGDDCVERYVLACAALGQLHPPGEAFSYCNAGFVIAGRIVEKLRGLTWDQALRRHLLDPTCIRDLQTLPEYALYYRAAVGHLIDPTSGDLKVAPVPFLTRSNGPAGATPFATARELLRFGRMHCAGGVSAEGERVLSEASVRLMQEPQISLPEGQLVPRWGLGWMLFDWGPSPVIGHDGGTLGHSSYFRMLPEQGVAVALLTNGGNTAALYRHVMNSALGELAGIELPPLNAPRATRIDASRYEGTYERLTSRHVVESEGDKLFMRSVERRTLVGAGGAAEVRVELEPMSEAVFVWSAPGSGFRNTATFVDFDAQRRPTALYAGSRRAPRVA